MALRELDRRVEDGGSLVVTLDWDDDANQCVVTVNDRRTESLFSIATGDTNPADVFHHPFAYATH